MTYIVASLLAGLLVAVFYCFQRTWSKTASARQFGCQPPVSYRHLDLLFGLDLKLQEVRQALKFRSIPFNAALFKKYGKTFQVNVFGSATIRTIDSENLQTAYATNNKDWGYEPIRLPFMEPFCGRGFITTDGATWKASRALLRPTFSKANISDLSAFQRSVDSFLQQIPRDGSTVDMQPLIASLFLQTAIKFLLGDSLDVLGGEGQSGDAKDFLKAFHNSMIGMGLSFMIGPFQLLIPKALKATAWQKAHTFIDACIDVALHDKNQARGKDFPDNQMESDSRSHSLLEGLAKQTDDRIAIRNQILQGMMAAQDTTSVLISNTMFLLSRNPATYERLRKEALSIDLDVSLPLFDNLKELKFLSNVLKESLRMYPIFPVLVRVALKDTTLPVGGSEKRDFPIYIPRGTKLYSDYYALHHVESVFRPDVEVFNPDRWHSISPGPWEYMPFSGGPRACVRQHKALAEASYTLVKIVQLFKGLESRDEKEWAGQMKLTARNANGCKVALIPA
ncbi:Cytochrome P450 monooxygenase [Lachnellula occidentalis]|uniref:Cytochrome P450 monooxygenase n=1 Tax=Lachnellula occidentalis TaxID=215460 RepID=A0A8H8UKS6_9HELO|nr:Cytochrome P450 monooxygenase [Lachnellula occidentalis]